MVKGRKEAYCLVCEKYIINIDPKNKKIHNTSIGQISKCNTCKNKNSKFISTKNSKKGSISIINK